jgi:hypothetical protein
MKLTNCASKVWLDGLLSRLSHFKESGDIISQATGQNMGWILQTRTCVHLILGHCREKEKRH